MLMQFWAMIVDCFREALDRKLFWVMAGISVLIAGVMACIRLDEAGIHVLFFDKPFETDVFAEGNPAGRARVGAVLTKYIGGIYISWIGIVIALVATAGIFPTLMERGAIDVVLAKPMSRPMIFLGKYFGGMIFVTIQASIFILLTLLVVGIRWGYWIWPYLWCIPLIVVLFSYVYAFCVLFGVVTRNSMAALLLTMLAWIGIYMPQAVHETLIGLEPVGIEIDEKWLKLSAAAKTIVPKTRDIPHIAGNVIGASTSAEVFLSAADPGPQSQSFSAVPHESTDGSISGTFSTGPAAPPSPDALVEAERKLADVSLVKSIGSSLLFEAVIVLIAMWKFSRRDF
ncbi:MAG: ABC transporter permease [Phycisphaerales bacterium]|nr:ABC transporter permease [Phycisphaerales bacterium]